jgi:Protein of unknown function (DUF4199)
MADGLLRSPLVTVPLRYGAVAGALCSIMVITLYYMGKHPFLINPFFDFRVPTFGLLIFFALKEVRDYFREGILNFFQGLGGSFVFLLTFTLVADTCIYIFGTLQPGFVSEYIRQLTEQIQNIPTDESDKMGKKVLQNSLKELPLTSLGYLVGLYAWQTLQIGFFISVIISVILRRQPKTP